MATVKYKCNVCDRDITLVENQQGITTFGHCIITQGCTGRLVPQSRSESGYRDSFPNEVAGLQDFTPRNALFTYTQTNLTTTWNIQHNLNTSVAVTVFLFDSNGILSPNEYNRNQYVLTIVDGNNLTIEFSAKVSGIANIVARTTKSPSISTITRTTPLTQVTTNGTFTFAVPQYLTKFTFPPTLPNINLPYKLLNVPIRIGTVLTVPNESPVQCFENIPYQLLNTPWNGRNEILVRKRKNFYTLSKNILDFEQTFQSQVITFNSIPQGSQLQFTSIDFGTGTLQPIESEYLYILLSVSPFTQSDRTVNALINVGNMLKNGGYFVYQYQDFYINSSYIEKTFPNINVVSSTV